MAHIKQSFSTGMAKPISVFVDFLNTELADWSDMQIDYEVYQSEVNDGIVYFDVMLNYQDRTASFNCKVDKNDEISIEISEGSYEKIAAYHYSIRNFWIVVAPQIFPI